MRKDVFFSSMLIIFLFFVLCFSSISMADKTYLALLNSSSETEFEGNVEVEIVEQTSNGTLSGCITGDWERTGIWLIINSGDYAGNGFFVGKVQGNAAGKYYESDAMEFYREAFPYDYGATFGDAGSTGDYPVYELTSIFGTQYSGTFYLEKLDETEESFSATIPLTVYSNTATVSLSGYYSGTMNISGLAFDFDVSSLEPFQEWGIDELIGFIGTYDWSETGAEEDGEIYFVYTKPIHLGAVTGELKGVLVATDLENYTAFIEHAGTAPPIPIPSTLLLFGSGLIGVLAIKRRNSG